MLYIEGVGTSEDTHATLLVRDNEGRAAYDTSRDPVVRIVHCARRDAVERYCDLNRVVEWANR